VRWCRVEVEDGGAAVSLDPGAGSQEDSVSATPDVADFVWIPNVVAVGGSLAALVTLPKALETPVGDESMVLEWVDGEWATIGGCLGRAKRGDVVIGDDPFRGHAIKLSQTVTLGGHAYWTWVHVELGTGFYNFRPFGYQGGARLSVAADTGPSPWVGKAGRALASGALQCWPDPPSGQPASVVLHACRRGHRFGKAGPVPRLRTDGVRILAWTGKWVAVGEVMVKPVPDRPGQWMSSELPPLPPGLYQVEAKLGRGSPLRAPFVISH
jgi:hypothetical protein